MQKLANLIAIGRNYRFHRSLRELPLHAAFHMSRRNRPIRIKRILGRVIFGQRRWSDNTARINNVVHSQMLRMGQILPSLPEIARNHGVEFV